MAAATASSTQPGAALGGLRGTPTNWDAPGPGVYITNDRRFIGLSS